MIQAYEVLEMLVPNGGWVVYGNDFEGIQFLECEPITKAQFEAGFAQLDAYRAQQAEAKAQAEAEAVAKRQALLDKLGITEDEARLLLGGN